MPATVWHDPGGTIVDGDVNCDTTSDILTDVLFHLDAVGWVEQSAVYSAIIGTFTGVPTNGQTVTIAGEVYTFVTVLAAAYDVLIGGSATACAANLADAINDNAVNEGTTYGVGTAANATCEASAATGVITVTRRTGVGNPWDTFTVADGLSNFTWAGGATTAFGGGSIMVSERNVEGLQYAMRIIIASATAVYFYPRSEDGSIEGPNQFTLVTTGGRTLKMSANRYGFMTRLHGSVNVAGTCIQTGLVKPRDGQTGIVISSVADNGSGLIRVTTATAHGMTTGQTIFNSGATNAGDFWSALNGQYTVTVIDTTTLDLDGSTYASGYDADSGVLGNTDRLSRAFYMQGDHSTAGFQGAGWRHGIAPQSTGGGGSPPALNAFVCANGNYYHYVYNATGGVSLIHVCTARSAYSNTAVINNYGPSYDWLIPRIGWPIANSGAEFQWVGDLYACAVIQHDIDIDAEKDDFDEANWLCYTDDDPDGSLMIVTTRSV